MAQPVVSPDPPPSQVSAPKALHGEKIAWARSHGGLAVPSNVDWLKSLSAEEREPWSRSVLRRPSRTLSGVAVVAVMTSPARCPHGRCTYCPGGIEARSPQSYTGEEPSALRGAQFHYNARRITEHRLASLEATGHSTSKVEVIVMGGTFPARPKPYRDEVFLGIFNGLNGFASPSIPEAQRLNETASHRCVSLTVETRPDWCDGRVLPDLLDAGVTRVEIGVECLDDQVLARTGRAHSLSSVLAATRESRDRGLKVCYHMMLGLPGMNPASDLAGFRELFDNPAYRPDMLKIYPTLVLPGTELYEEWKADRYQPYDVDTAAQVLVEIKGRVPPWVRIQRIQRDIPSRLIAAGVRTSNIRELALRRLAAAGQHCRCLRCRELGRRSGAETGRFERVTREYEAAGGQELFLSWEDPIADVVVGFLRLRFPSDQTVGGLTVPVIRELKVLGREVPVGTGPVGEIEAQHRGVGRGLVQDAERITAERGWSELAVLSAVGTREYYRRLGFSGKGAHLVKPTRDGS